MRRIVGQLAGALSHVHARSWMHRDIKPSNVLVTTEGRAKLLDFGLARPHHLRAGKDLAEDVIVSESVSHCIGTPRYMAPEQFFSGSFDHRVDIYGLACVAYEALSGYRVAASDDLLGMLEQKHRFELPAAIDIGDGVSQEMRSFLAVGLARRPEERDVQLDEIAKWAGPVSVNALLDPGSRGGDNQADRFETPRPHVRV